MASIDTSPYSMRSAARYADPYFSMPLPVGPGWRVLNYVLDRLFLYFAWFFVMSFTAAFNGQAVTGDHGLAIGCFVWFFVSFTYYFLFELILGKTLAKYATRTNVLEADGTKPRASSILIRALTRFVPFEALSFLGSNGWHDAWSGTMVVRDR